MILCSWQADAVKGYLLYSSTNEFIFKVNLLLSSQNVPKRTIFTVLFLAGELAVPYCDLGWLLIAPSVFLRCTCGLLDVKKVSEVVNQTRGTVAFGQGYSIATAASSTSLFAR